MFSEKNGPVDSGFTSIKNLSGHLSPDHSVAQLEGFEQMLTGSAWSRKCHLRVSFDTDPLGTYASRHNGADKKPSPPEPTSAVAQQPGNADKASELEKAKTELAALKAQLEAAKAAQTSANAAVPVIQPPSAQPTTSVEINVAGAPAAAKAEDFATISQLNADVDVLKTKLGGYRDLEEQLRSAFEAKTESSITDLKTKLQGLAEDPTTKNNSKEINTAKEQIDALQKKSLLDDPVYASLAAKVSELQRAVEDREAVVRAELAANQTKNDLQRAKDLQDISSKFNQLNDELNVGQKALDSKIDAYKVATQTKLQILVETLNQLNARTAAVEKRQLALAANQAELAQQQAKTEQSVNTAREILGNILLPVSEKPGDWMMRVAAVPIQQQQFCRIIDQFYDRLSNVYQFRNEIKKNALYRDRQQDLASLLPDGAINSWVVRVVEVTQAADGSAAIMLQPPCRAMLGSDACASQGRKIRATIPSDSLMYRELARVNTGDFVTISGTILYAQAVDPNTVLPDYAVYEPKNHCSSADGAQDEDVFVTQLNMLAMLR